MKNLNNIKHFNNVEEFESLLRSRSEDNVSIFAEKLELDDFELSMTLCEFHDLEDSEWIENISERFNINYEEVFAAMMDLWILVGDKASTSPLINKKALRL